MADQELKDARGRLLGKIKITSATRHEARDSAGRLVGHYNPKNNETRDSAGRLVGKGNLLATLIPPR